MSNYERVVDYNALGNTLRLERVRRGWTQDEVAQRSGVGRSYISKMEQGEAGRVSVGAVIALARTLEVPLLDLLGLTDDDKPEDVAGEVTELYDALSQRRRIEWVALGKTLWWIDKQHNGRSDTARILDALLYDELYTQGKLLTYLNRFLGEMMGRDAGENLRSRVEAFSSIGDGA